MKNINFLTLIRHSVFFLIFMTVGFGQANSLKRLQKVNQSNTKTELLCRRWELVEYIIYDIEDGMEMRTTIVKPIPVEKKQVYVFNYDNSFKQFIGANEIEKDGLWSFNNDSTSLTLTFQRKYVDNRHRERIEEEVRTFLITKLTADTLILVDGMLESSVHLMYTSK